MILHMCADHLHHLSICSCSLAGRPSFRMSRMRDISCGVNWIPFLFALVMSAIITGASDLPLLPAVCFAASRISSSFDRIHSIYSRMIHPAVAGIASGRVRCMSGSFIHVKSLLSLPVIQMRKVPRRTVPCNSGTFPYLRRTSLLS